MPFPCSHPRLGVFIGVIDDSFQSAVWKSIAARAGERGAEVIGFVGHGLGAPLPGQNTLNIAYRLAKPANVDAVIVLSNTVGNFQGPDGVARLISDSALPAVSIEFPVPGVPSVSARGGRGMAELVRHLIRRHGRRSLALVTGPAHHADSIEREAAFREVLGLEGLELPDELLFRGQFYRESGRDAVRSFLASGASFDAVVCLNDYSALGAMEELKARGLAVPSEVSVTGFDDIMEARWASSPLTTVRQPLARLGAGAVDMALDLLAGKDPPSMAFDCDFIVRQSCGCPPLLPLEEGKAVPPGGAEADSRLARDFAEACAEGGTAELLRALDRALPPQGGTERDSKPFENLRRAVYEARGSFGEGGSSSLGAFDQGIEFLNGAQIREEVQRSISAMERGRFLRQLSSRLLGTFSPGALARNWEECLKPLGFKRGFLVLFVPPVERGGLSVPGRSVLVSASPTHGSGVRREEFQTELLLPPGLDVPWSGSGWLLEPLVYHDEALGYILLECGSEDSNSYEPLRMEMSTAVKATLLMDEIRESERSLETLVGLRTRELREVNRDLKAQIERRRTLEMEIQEISNRTMQSIGQDIHDDLCQHLVGISMLAAVMEDTLVGTGSISIDSIREIRALIESAVSRSRQFARTLYPAALDDLGFVSALEDLIETLGRTSGGISLSFQREGDCRIEDSGVALQLYRIVQEALTNALKHSGSDVVVLRLVGKEGSLLAEVRDFGVGLGASSGADGRGMGLRIMRYRAESIGARLEINNLDPGVCVSCSLGQ